MLTLARRNSIGRGPGSSTDRITLILCEQILVREVQALSQPASVGENGANGNSEYLPVAGRNAFQLEANRLMGIMVGKPW